MGIQINQLCNMNIKFVALFLFAGVTSATWCWYPANDWSPADRCPGETKHGEATANCCDEIKSHSDRGCWVDSGQALNFLNCCKTYNCTEVVNVVEYSESF